MMATSMFLNSRMKVKLRTDGTRFVPPVKIFRQGSETFTLGPSDPTSDSASFPNAPGRPFSLTICTPGPYTTAFLCFDRSSISEWHQAFHDQATVTLHMQIWSNGSFIQDELLTVELECYENPLPAVAEYIQGVKDASKELVVAFVGFLSAVFRLPGSNKARKLRDEPAPLEAIDVLPDAVGPGEVRVLGSVGSASSTMSG